MQRSKITVRFGFFRGALLQENTYLLVNAQEGITKAQRQIRFEAGSKIDTQELLKYIEETISMHKQGKEIKPDFKKKIIIPSELTLLFNSNSELKKAFSVLTPGKQREYAEYITEAKRDETKQKRIEKIIPMIIAGIGLKDKYKNC